MDDTISRAEHDEFCKRMEEAHKRSDRRIELLEKHVREMGALTASVEKLALNMENMAKEQERQGERLEALEGRDGEMWRKVVGYVLTAVISVTVGFIFSRIGF